MILVMNLNGGCFGCGMDGAQIRTRPVMSSMHFHSDGSTIVRRLGAFSIYLMIRMYETTTPTACAARDNLRTQLELSNVFLSCDVYCRNTCAMQLALMHAWK